jgi:hypothetical protein
MRGTGKLIRQSLYCEYNFAPMMMDGVVLPTLRLQCAVGHDVGGLEKTQPESDPELWPQARAHPPLHRRRRRRRHRRFFRPPHFPSSRFFATGATSRL